MNGRRENLLDTVSQRRKELEDLKSATKEIRGGYDFNYQGVLPELIEKISEHVRNGRLDYAVRACDYALERGRGMLAAFLRGSVIEGRNRKVPHFAREIVLRRRKSYDSDLIASLDKARRELEEAVLSENGSDFSRRIAAYNKLCSLLPEKDEQQQDRWRKRSRQRLTRMSEEFLALRD